MLPTQDQDPDGPAGRVSRGQAAVLGRMMAALTRPLSPDEFFGQVLTAIAEQLGSDSTALFFHDPARDTISVHTCYDQGAVKAWNPEPGHPPQSLHLPTALFPIWAVLRADRRPYTLSDPASLPPSPMRDWFHVRGMRQVLFAPLVLGEVIGFLSIPSTREDAYTPEHADMAQALAHQTALAVRLGRMAEQARDAAVAAERDRAARDRAADRQAAILEERSRLAREIHDTLAQAFVGVVTLLEAAKDAAVRRPEKAQACVLDALRAARDGLDEARRSVRALRPLPLDGGDLSQALRRLAERPGDGGAAVAVHVHGPPRPLAAEVEQELYRIAQEALANSLRHARASAIGIELAFEPAAVRLAIRDDGDGFDPHATEPPATFGLLGMRERAARVGGTLSVASVPGGGTVVTALVPTGGETG